MGEGQLSARAAFLRQAAPRRGCGRSAKAERHCVQVKDPWASGTSGRAVMLATVSQAQGEESKAVTHRSGARSTWTGPPSWTAGAVV